VTFQPPFKGKAKSELLSAAHDFHVIVHNSQLIVQLVLSDVEAVDIFTLRNIAANHARMITDFFGYQRGCSLDVDISSAVCAETDDWQMFGIEIPILMKRRGSGPQHVLPLNEFAAFINSSAAQLALADFREAIQSPIGTGFFCFRAIEAMMQTVRVSEDEKNALIWERFRNLLQIERSAIDAVKKHADFPRHGRLSNITDAERAMIFRITDEIIRRFMESLIRGNGLSADEFPLLSN
jgi:hypothetical protein